MNLTETALKYNRVTYMCISIIFLMGILSYFSLSRDSMPPYTVRICNVVTYFPGASPQRVEELVTQKIEEIAQELPELDNVTSTSRTGLSVVQVEVTADIQEENLQAIWDRLRRKVEAIRSELPETAYDPEIEDDDVGVVYGIIIGLESDGFSFADMKNYAEDIRDDLIKVEGAAKVDISGVQEEQIYVEFDKARLAEIGLTTSSLQNIISTTNIVYPGGDVSLKDKRIKLEPTGNYESLDDLKETLIPLANGKTVQLGDITHITRTYADPSTQIVKINGKPSLTISVALKDGGNLTKLGELVDQRMEAYNEMLPHGLEVKRIATQDYYVKKKVSDFLVNVIQSIVVVLVVMLVFLGLRTGFIVASLIPMAMVSTILLMSVFEIGLNQVSLAALIVALGLLVDNAIVVSESILVKMEEGIPARQAAIGSCSELSTSLLISSLTTSAAFLSFFLAANTMGEIMGPLFSVITLTLMSSWVMALTLVTSLCVAFIRVKVKDASQNEKKSVFDLLIVYYDKILKGSLHYANLTILIIVVSFVASLALFPMIPFTFMPDSDRNLVTVDLKLPQGSKIEKTEAEIAILEKYIRENFLKSEENPEGIVRDWASFIGEGPYSYDLGYSQDEPSSAYAHMLINTTDQAHNAALSKALDKFSFDNLPDSEVTVSLLATGESVPDVEVRIYGDDAKVLFDIADSVRKAMNNIPFAYNIVNDWGIKSKKFIVDIEQDKAQRAGLSNQDIAISLQTALSGFNSGSFRDGDDNIPIVLRTEGSQQLDAQESEDLNIFAQGSGKNIPLVQVASVETQWQYAKIKRRDLYRALTISCYAREGYTASDVTEMINPIMEGYAKTWPYGYSYELGGESETSDEALGAVAAKLPISGFLIILLLVLQFNSLRKTFIVLASIPLGLIGVILGLILFQSYFGFMAFLGVISLAGIVINNAIVLIDRIELEKNENKRKPYDAIVEAAKQRFRPILLTTFTTTFGLIPLYLGGGLMWEPMAVAIMVGLLFATIITLVFVPALYKVLFSVKKEEA